MAKKLKLNRDKILAQIKKYSFGRKKFLTLGIILLVILALLFIFRSLVFAALVNNRPILRTQVEKELEKQAGKEVLASLIDKSLISQEASRAKIKIGQDAIDAEIKRIEDMLRKQNMSLDDALKAQGQTKESLIEQIKLQKTVEAILGSKLNITDAEMKKYFEDNKTLFGKDAKFEDVKDQVKSQLTQEKLSTEYQKWIADLRAKAKILYFVKF